MLLILVLCVICPAALLSNVHTVLPESYDDRKPIDVDEYRVRNYVSDHELPKDVPTRIKIVGDLGTPPPSVNLDFVPKQTYVQVRRYDAVKRLPQEAAMEEAATSEEMANAPRLREVVTHKKTQEVYEEQGYEDAGYDHGGSKKLKVEEEVKDNQSVEILGPSNSSSQSTEETKDDAASIAPSGRGTWSRHKTTTGKKTRYEADGDKRKITTNDNNPISEKSSGNYTKFDGGKTIIVQNVTEMEKKDSKKEGAESRRVASFSKTKDNVEPTTYRPTIRRNSTRNANKQFKNEPKRNRTRSMPRKRQEVDIQKLQTDVIGSIDNSPWIPISPPTDYNAPQPQNKKQIKSKINSELHEPNGHATKYGYTVNHDIPYKYVFPTDLLAPESSNKPNRKLRSKPENTGVTDGKPKVSPFVNYRFIPQTNYDGSAIHLKQNKKSKSSEEDLSFDNIPLSDKYKEPITQFKTHFTHNTKQDGSAIIQKQKNKPVQIGSSEHFNSNLKPESYREQKQKSPRDVETELGSYGNSGSWYTGTVSQDFGSPKTYNAPFITRRKKNNVNIDLRGDPSLRVYPKYEYYPNFQNVKYPVNDGSNYGHIPLSNMNKGQANIEFHESPSRSKNQESARLSEYSKFDNRPQHIRIQSSSAFKNLDNYPKNTDPTSQLSEEKHFRFNKAEDYPKFEPNKSFERTGNKSPSMYRLIPHEKTVKTNNPYSYVTHDDHYPSGSRYSGVKVEATTQSPKVDSRFMYWNSRHPHLPKDSIKNITDVHKGKSQEENTRHVENLTLAHFSGFRKSGFYRPLPLEHNERVNNLAKLLNDNYPKRTRRDLEVIHIASSGTTTEIPIDTVVYPHYKRAPKQSALRYATNPNLTPRKTAGGMEFYASTDSVKCNGMEAPTGIVPERTEDGEWKGEPSNKTPRVDDLGDQIGCLKTKFFGSDPLDNPLFKEKDVGFPDILYTMKKHPENKKHSIEPGKPHVDWNFAEKLIPGQWFSNDKRKRRSDNNSLPINHKVQGMASIIPEPVILTFPTKSSMVVYTNDTKINKEDNDTQVSSNHEHVFQYSVLHPTSKPESNIHKDHYTDNKIVGLIPPPQSTKKRKLQKVKKPTVKKILKKIKFDDDSDESNFFDVLSPITSFFIDEDDSMVAPIVHNFFNIKMAPSVKLKATTMVDKNNGKKVNKFQIQNYRRTKRNMKGVELQIPRQRKLNIDTDTINTNVSLSLPTAKVRMYTPKNGTWFREKREQVSVNVDVRRKEPRYYYHTERPPVRVKRVVHNPPFNSRSGQVFSSKYLISDQDNSETLPEEINVAFSTTPKPIYWTTPKFIPAIAFGDSKTKIINYNDSIANSTNDNEHTQFDKKGSLIYVINPDTGLGKWMKVIKVKNEEDTKPAFTNGPVYLETKAKDVSESIGKFGFKGPSKDLFKNALGSTMDSLSHRFKHKLPSNEPIKNEAVERPKCPKFMRPSKKEIRRRTTTTTSTTEIPVVEEDLDDIPEDQNEEEETTPPPREGEEEEGGGGGEEGGDGGGGEEGGVEGGREEGGDGGGREEGGDEGGGEEGGDKGSRGGGEGENEEEQPVERPVKRPHYQQESEGTPDNTEDDQEVYESKRKKPYSMPKKPEFHGYRYRPRDKNNILIT